MYLQISKPAAMLKVSPFSKCMMSNQQRTPNFRRTAESFVTSIMYRKFLRTHDWYMSDLSTDSKLNLQPEYQVLSSGLALRSRHRVCYWSQAQSSRICSLPPRHRYNLRWPNRILRYLTIHICCSKHRKFNVHMFYISSSSTALNLKID